MDQVEEIKNKIDIVQLVGEYVQLKKAGRNYKGLCPFHGEKTPSFMVNPELQIYKCFGCGEGGDAYQFLQKMEGMEFGEALAVLAERVGVKLTSYKPTKQEEDKQKILKINSLAGEYYHYLLTTHKLGIPAKKYLEKRGITNEAVTAFKIGYAPEGWDFLMKFLVAKKGFLPGEVEAAGLVIKSQNTRGYYDRFRDRVMFPLTNARGMTVGFAGRVMPGADEKMGAKYVNTPETEVYHKGNLLYGLDINKAEIKTAGFAVVVEGEIDAIASWQAGVKNAVAIKGSALTVQQVDIIKRYCDTLVLGLDADVAGDAAVRRGIEIAQKAQLIIKIIDSQSAETNPKQYKDPGDWAIADPEGWQTAVKGAIPIYDFYIESAVKRFGLEAIGKTKISRELIPIWAKIDDAIVKAHYIKRLAVVMGVDEADVRDQITKTSSTVEVKRGGETNKPVTINTSRREIFEEYLVKMALFSGDVSQLVEGGPGIIIQSDFWRRVIESFKKEKDLWRKPTELVNKLPPELTNKVQQLLLTEEEITPEIAREEWNKAVRELEQIDIREKLEVLRHLSEKPGTDQEVVKLTRRLAELTKSM